MRNIEIVFSCLCLALIMAHSSTAKEWRGIVPLHSTREDVIRLLGPSNTSLSDVYNLENERVTFTFSTGSCQDKVPSEWNVPLNTVISIDVYPKKTIKVSDMQIDETKYEKRSDKLKTDYVYYLDENEGILITTLQGSAIKSISYIPAAIDNDLRCRSSATTKTIKPFNRIFDVYGNIPSNIEKTRLDNFATQLQRDPDTNAYIITYAGRRARVGEACERAIRVRDYLINMRGIDNKRIVVVDGGYRETPTTELFIVPLGYAPSASPTIAPSEVQIIQNINIKTNSRSPRTSRAKRNLCQ